MNDFLNTVMNFINENTTLLIIICVFLIFVLVGYLIDNSVKSRKLAKKKQERIESGVVEEETVPEEVVPVEINKEVEVNTVEEEVKEPIIPEPVVETKIENEEELTKTVEVPEVEPLNEIKTTSFDDIDYEENEDIELTPDVHIDEDTVEVSDIPSVDDISEPAAIEANEMSIDPKINELLNKDFSKEIENVNNIEDEPANRLDELLLHPKVEEVKEEKKDTSKYKNSKSLAEILGNKNNSKVNETIKEELKSTEVDNKNPDLMNTVDFQNELDRILKKINENSIDIDSNDGTLDETTDFSNMF